MLKTSFSAPQNANNEQQSKHKSEVRNLRFIEFWFLEYGWLYLLLG